MHKAIAFAALVVAAAAYGTVDITQNQIGRLTSAGNAATRTFTQYDSQGRVVATQVVQDGQSRTFTTIFGYPQNPQSTAGPGMVVVAETFPDGERVEYTYDASGVQIGVRSVFGAASEDVVRDVRYNARGQLTLLKLGNGTVTTRTYDDDGNLALKSSTTVDAAGQKLEDYGFTYDPLFNVKGTTDGVRPELSATYGYDELGQLKDIFDSAGSPLEHYEYDKAGNLTQKGGIVQTYGAGGRPHALDTSAAVQYGYDANGNVTSIGGATTIVWNAEDMPATVTTGSVVTKKSFIGEALWKKEEQGVTTYYMPSLRVENGVLRKFYGTFAERLEVPGDRALRFYHPDHLGSSTVMTDQSGAVIHRAAYLPWGTERSVEGTFTPKLQFNFKEKESNGFYDYGARLYNPGTGRWLSPDDHLDDGLNRYAYGRNNPWSLTDPTGHGGQDQDPRKPPSRWDPGCDRYDGSGETGCFEYDEVVVTESNLDHNSKEWLPSASTEYDSGMIGFYVIHQPRRVTTFRYGFAYNVPRSESGGLNITDTVWINQDGTADGREDTGEAGVILDNNPFDYELPINIVSGARLLFRDAAEKGLQRVFLGAAEKRVFWTQGMGAEAGEFATQIGGHTLEQTVAGRGVSFAEKFVGPERTYRFWKALSGPFASGARDPYLVFGTPTKAFGNVVLKTEVPRMTIAPTAVRATSSGFSILPKH